MIRGDVFTFADALGAAEGDARLERALAFVGGDVEAESFTEGGTEEKYLIAVGRGVEFLLTDGVVSTVFVYASEVEGQSVYGGWGTLVEGVGPQSTSDEIVRALGEPVASTDEFLRYETDAGFVQFVFEGGRLKMLGVMKEVIGAGSPVDVPPVVAGALSVEGDLAVVMRAVGRAMFSPEHVEVIGLVGPATDSRDDVRDGVAWQYEDSSRTGVLLQFKQELLVGVLIRLRGRDGEAAYPFPERLIEGLVLPAAREAVAGHFGTPERSSQHMDLYLVDGVYLRFDFDEDGQGTSLTVIQPGAEA